MLGAFGSIVSINANEPTTAMSLWDISRDAMLTLSQEPMQSLSEALWLYTPLRLLAEKLVGL